MTAYRLPDDVPGLVLAFVHDSMESAQAAAETNRANGLPAEVETRTLWVSTVDLRPAMAEAEARFRASEASGD